ncbi:AAA-ATPase ASD, mitochondrial [Vitis vinifera]|uniref:AAA-ATPase ASD, mitochondrial n=1 Tax=Vitis vinifera TaxID=29760 RepID=A0A438JI87_VITVI|nr:AAA-ATPase ASD, mitochondrial [Vitis vinifera]
MMMMMGEMWAKPGSLVAGAMFLWVMFQKYTPHQFRSYIEKYSQKLVSFVYPYIQITFQEFSEDRFKRSEAYVAIENYLSVNASTRAKRLKADVIKDSQSLVLSMDDREEITDEFKGVKLWWASHKNSPKTQTFSFYPAADEKRFYKLTFHKNHREMFVGSYLNHVMKEGKAIEVRNRQRKLYTNNPSDKWHGYRRTLWSHVAFEHPARFETLAMEPKKKEEIVNDLTIFSRRKEYYSKIGKAWKRGYLLYGPPGTGKSTMIAAMANLLDYDIYDLELTSVKNNTELRMLLIETRNKSIIVIEDIDCSLDLTGQRKKKKETNEEEKKDPIRKMEKEGESKESKVTLSGLLNVIDGLWSTCGEERLIIFTTNYVEKLDPALIRRGRMDKHIELSYCCFEAFKVLAKNYLDLDSHHLFASIRRLLEETNMTPADVAENLMPKSVTGDPGTTCLESLIQALETAKEEARVKAEKEAKEKEEEEERLKGEKEGKEKEATAGEVKEKETSGEKEKQNGVAVKENGVV